MEWDDLISREAAIEAIISITAFESEDELKKFVEEKACDDYYLGGLYDAIDEIKDTTVVDAAPVVHARWTTERTWRHDGEWYCSVCEYEPIVFMESNYCPHCGAKMDGERRDDE